MKQKISRLFVILGFIAGITFSVLICTIQIPAQQGQQPPPEFIIGAFLGRDTRTNQAVYNTFDSTGMNTVVQYAHDSTRSYLEDYNVIANNADRPQDWIQHYATGFYSKWEAEQDQTVDTLIGVKHKFGQLEEWLGKQCWSTKGLSSPADSLLYGPHYRREKEYQRWLYNSNPYYRRVYYNAKYRMALHNPYSVNPNEEVCRITARVRHAVLVNGVWTGHVVDDTLGVPITLKVSDFPQDGSFKEFLIVDYSYLPDYPERLNESKLEIPSEEDTAYTDSDGENGIEFLVEWLRDDTLCTLYVDYVEVYDDDGWDDYLSDPQTVIDNIQSYAQSYSGWDNIIYWFAHDEPYTIDAYIPMHTVDSLVRDVRGAPLITEFYPSWQVFVNNDSQLVRYYNMVQPRTLMIDFYPISKDYYPIRAFDLEATRNQFQICHTLQPGFFICFLLL